MTQSLMPPDYEVSNPVGNTVELLRGGTKIPSIKVKINYTDLGRKNKYAEEYDINLGSFLFEKKVVDKSEYDFIESISKSLAKIQEDLSSFLRRSREPR